MNKQSITILEAKLFNNLLDLTWSNPAVTYEDILNCKYEATLVELVEALQSLADKKLILKGVEYVNDVRMTTITPMLKGGNAYAYPVDFFDSYEDWMRNAVEVPRVV